MAGLCCPAHLDETNIAGSSTVLDLKVWNAWEGA